MIARVWRATATEEGAKSYAEHFGQAVLPQLKRLDGFQRAFLMRRLGHDGTTEIQVITHWESMEKIRGFAGDDIDHAVVAPEARKALVTYDETVTHYDVVEP